MRHQGWGVRVRNQRGASLMKTGPSQSWSTPNNPLLGTTHTVSCLHLPVCSGLYQAPTVWQHRITVKNTRPGLCPMHTLCRDSAL